MYQAAATARSESPIGRRAAATSSPAPTTTASPRRPGATSSTSAAAERGRRPSPMAKLIYSAITSLDGYIEDTEGKFDWAAPDEEVHAFVNNLERPVGTYLLGRRMYETMVFWETAHTLADEPSVIQDFAEIWQAADKIVYSRTLDTVSTARTRIE